MASRPDDSNVHKLKREVESGSEKIRLYKLEIKELRASNYKLGKQLLVIRESSALIPRRQWKSKHLKGVLESISCQAELRIMKGGRCPYILKQYYYPKIRWAVDDVRDGISKLYESQIKTLGATEPLSIELKDTSLGDLLELIDQTRRVLQTKWQQVVREIKIMELAVTQCLKPDELRTPTNVEGIDDQLQLKSDYWYYPTI
ncbi:hypothetical protein PtB15_7B597 [Puccinia triticina]|nr:hypothetical protein PtB15_7B597 [Puccinia triticina]